MKKQEKKPKFLEELKPGTTLYLVESASKYVVDFSKVEYVGYKTDYSKQTYQEYWPTSYSCETIVTHYIITVKDGKRKRKLDCTSPIYWDGIRGWNEKEHLEASCEDFYFTTDKELARKYIEEKQFETALSSQIESLQLRLNELKTFLNDEN